MASHRHTTEPDTVKTNAKVACEADEQINGLSFLWLELTARCNLSCIHCYAESSPRRELLGKMNERDWLRILKDATSLGCSRVQFIGGEPTVHPCFQDLVQTAFDDGYEFIEVFTNATRLTVAHLKAFSRCGVRIATSFYSDSASVHDSITGVGGSFERTLNGIRNCLDRSIPLRVGVIETPKNTGHASRAKCFLKQLGVTEIGCDRMRFIGRGDIGGLRTSEASQLCGQCWKRKLCVTADARTYPCVFARATDLGDIRDGLHRIIQSQSLRRFRQSLRESSFTRGVADCGPQVGADYCEPDTKDDCEPDSDCAPRTKTPCTPQAKSTPDESCRPKCNPNDDDSCSPA